MTVSTFLAMASGMAATTYGYGEEKCGDTHAPKACISEATTASGIPLLKGLPIVAVAMPANLRLRAPRWVSISIDGGKTCHAVLLADKKHERHIGGKAWDFTPRALETVGVKPSRHWSIDKVVVCK